MKAREDAKAASDKRVQVDAEREKVTKVARHEAERILREAREAADEVFRELDSMRKQAAKDANWQQVNEARSQLRRELNKAEDKLIDHKAAVPEETPKPTRAIRLGDTVEILSIGAKAQVLAISPDRILTLQAGIMKVTAKESEVRLIEDNTLKKQVEKYTASVQQSFGGAVKPELDIRGMASDEAVPVMEKFLDSARLAKLNIVTIIHGKGTGVLRQAVHVNLRRNPHVKSFRLGRYGEGESGVTVIELK